MCTFRLLFFHFKFFFMIFVLRTREFRLMHVEFVDENVEVWPRQYYESNNGSESKLCFLFSLFANRTIMKRASALQHVSITIRICAFIIRRFFLAAPSAFAHFSRSLSRDSLFVVCSSHGLAFESVFLISRCDFFAQRRFSFVFCFAIQLVDCSLLILDKTFLFWLLFGNRKTQKLFILFCIFCVECDT